MFILTSGENLCIDDRVMYECDMDRYREAFFSLKDEIKINSNNNMILF